MIPAPVATPWAALLTVAGLGASFACGAPSGPAGSEGSSRPDLTAVPSAQRQLAGAWSLERIEHHDAGGEPLSAPLEDRIGFLIYDAMGYVALTIAGPEEAPASPEGSAGDEARAPPVGYMSYFGRFTVIEAEGVVIHGVAGSLPPDGAAAEYRHPYTLAEDRLTLQWTPAPDGSTAVLTWVRQPDLPSSELGDAHRQLFGAYRIESVARHTTDAYEVEVDQYDDGYLFYAPSGHMSVHLLAPDRAPYPGEPQADNEMLLRTAHYFGPFSLNEVAGCITCPGPRDQGYLIHHPEANEEAGGNRTEVRRYYELTDSHLMLRPPVHRDEEGREVITVFRWARLLLP